MSDPIGLPPAGPPGTPVPPRYVLVLFGEPGAAPLHAFDAADPAAATVAADAWIAAEATGRMVALIDLRDGVTLARWFPPLAAPPDDSLRPADVVGARPAR